MGLFNLGYKQLLNSFLMTKMNLWTLFYKLKRFFGPMAIPVCGCNIAPSVNFGGILAKLCGHFFLI